MAISTGRFRSNSIIGALSQRNPEWKEEGDNTLANIWSERQVQVYGELMALLKEFQVDVAEPISNVARISASAYTRVLDKRREKDLSKIRRNNSKAATAIN